MASNDASDPFKAQFLKYYLQSGFGILSKKNVDSLVMYLLDEYGMANGKPLREKSNQEISVMLKIPATHVKTLRYEAALKFGGMDSDKSKFKLLEILAKSHFEMDKDRVVFVMEDSFIRNWVQGLLKEKGIVFDTSFNRELVKVNTNNFCELLSQLYEREAVKKLRKGMEKARDQQTAVSFPELKKEFLKGAANGIGNGITQTAITLLLGLVKG